MKLLVALISILALSGMTLFFQDSSSLQSTETTQSREHQLYQAWKIKYGKNQSEDRFNIFQSNLKFIEEHNNSNSSFTLALNEFADLTNEEYRQTKLMTNQGPAPKRTPIQNFQVDPNAGSINWITKGAVTSVKNQGNCGSCWAFSATAGLEGAYEISTGNLVNLSDQQVTACTPSPSYGCNGGWPYTAYQYTSSYGIETDAEYPYAQASNPTTEPCYYDSSKTIWNNKGAATLPTNNPEAMLTQLQTQPLSILIAASSSYFQFYNGGILDTPYCGTATDHAVLLAGYEQSGNYWIIKNSWGTSWGAQGYVYVLNQTGPGVCGINQTVDYPTF